MINGLSVRQLRNMSRQVDKLSDSLLQIIIRMKDINSTGFDEDATSFQMLSAIDRLSMSQYILDSLDGSIDSLNSMKLAFNSALSECTKFLEYKSVSSLANSRNDSHINPENYYNFKCFDSGCAIVSDSREILSDGSWKKVPKKLLYHISCFNYIPKIWSPKSDNSLLFSPKYNYYGNFDSLESALPYFYDACYDISSTLSGKSFQLNLFKESL